MDKKIKNAQKIVPITDKEKKELVQIVNKMTTLYDYIQSNMHNTQWMDTDHAPLYKGLPAGLSFIHTRSLASLTNWLRWLTITLVVLTIAQILVVIGSKLAWF